MKWTSETPTKEGWYWYRWLNGNVRMVRLRKGWIGHLWALLDYADLYGTEPSCVDFANGLWSGPIPEPEE